MDEQTIRKIVAEVVSGQLAKADTAPCHMPQTEQHADIPVEVSARHVHLTTEAVEKLFGKGAKLTKKRELSQPGEFLSEQRLKLVTAKGEILNVAVLGPERTKVQVELSFTDARQLGINAPLSLSGSLAGAGDVYLVGDCGMVEARGSVIVAKSHIHMTPKDAAHYGVTDGQQVSVAACSPRPVTFQGVTVRVSEGFALAMHIDFDEANACAASCGTKGRLVVGIATPVAVTALPGVSTPTPCAGTPAWDTKVKVITESVALGLAAAGGTTVFLPKGVIVTPSARDVFTQKGIDVKHA
ncbi:MAG: phosphate propanoyltransferase [Angelakisella sp.]